MEKSTYSLNLKDYRTPGSKVFTGRPRGKFVREKSNIDQIENGVDKITVIIPEDIASINPSFLEELFENVVAKLGKAKFYDKVEFDNPGRYKIDTDLSEAIDRILRDHNALA